MNWVLLNQNYFLIPSFWLSLCPINYPCPQLYKLIKEIKNNRLNSLKSIKKYNNQLLSSHQKLKQSTVNSISPIWTYQACLNRIKASKTQQLKFR